MDIFKACRRADRHYIPHTSLHVDLEKHQHRLGQEPPSPSPSPAADHSRFNMLRSRSLAILSLLCMLMLVGLEMQAATRCSVAAHSDLSVLSLLGKISSNSILDNARSANVTVGIEFGIGGSKSSRMDHYVEIPLRRRIRPGEALLTLLSLASLRGAVAHACTYMAGCSKSNANLVSSILADLAGLPSRPRSARIVGAFSFGQEASSSASSPSSSAVSSVRESGPRSDGRSFDQDRSSRIICLAYPERYDGDASPFAPYQVPSSRTRRPSQQAWWRIADGTVRFDDPVARWWIPGADVESLECI